jgi:nicotinate (nicotinamide) nucleotide adenylyltransferase
METIIVMGGSFNPPTRAHLELMLAAAGEMRNRTGGPVRGVFVPSSAAYLRKKQAEGDPDRIMLPEALRLSMLGTFTAYGPLLSADGRELGTETVRGHTLGTLRAIREENPGAAVCFLLGADKLRGFPGWKYFGELVSEFMIIVAGRDGTDVRALMDSIPELRERKGSFIVLDQPDGAADISSGKVRKALETGEEADMMLTPEVSTMLKNWMKTKIYIQEEQGYETCGSIAGKGRSQQEDRAAEIED